MLSRNGKVGLDLLAEGRQRVTRLALFVPSLAGGGAERMMVNLANAFAARGYSVDLVLACPGYDYLAEVEPVVRIVKLGARRVILSLPALVRYLRSEQPSAVLSALSHANVVLICARMIARIQTRIFVSERNTLQNETSGTASLKDRAILCLMRLLYPQADGAIAVSRGVATDLVKVVGLDSARVHTVYNPVVSAQIAIYAQQAAPHCWLQPGGPPVILAVGRLTAQKDFHTLIRAFSEVREQQTCRLIILGEGEERESLQALVSELGLTDSVLLPGFQENPFAWMSRAAVFVLSSKWEGLPGVLIQAMACGAPVVSTDCHSGPREILEDGRWGHLVPVGDSKSMADAILAVMRSAQQPDVVCRASDFSVSRSADHYLDLLLSC